MKYSAFQTTNGGTVITASKLNTAVKVIDSAKVPPASRVRMFDVTPPGQNDSIITPSASSGGSGNTIRRQKAITGSKTTCANAPIEKPIGVFATRAKSAIVRLMPSENIMKASDSGKKTSKSTPIDLSPSFELSSSFRVSSHPARKFTIQRLRA